MTSVVERLFAWRDAGLVGIFERQEDGGVGFSYAAGAGAPVSLSLPIEGGWDGEAPARFLEALLPDRAGERAALRLAYGARDATPFGLLPGSDASGGLSFTTAEEPPESAAEPRAVPDEELAAVLRTVRRTSRFECEPTGRARFLLAGSQGKVALAMVEGGWAWPSAAVPSTHVAKPGSPAWPGIERVEAATMRLARACGVEVAKCRVVALAGEESYVVERFDREMREGGSVRRLHAEDLSQALGADREAKHTALLPEDVVPLLVRADPTRELACAWFDQAMVCASVGNGDAHAKNFSIVLDDAGKPHMSPMYDVVCTLMWDGAGDALPFPVNWVCHPWDVTPADWKAEAAEHGLDGDRFAERAVEIARSAVERAEQAASGLPPELAERFMEAIRRCNARMLRCR